MGLTNKSYKLTLNQRVQGSSPCAPTILLRAARFAGLHRHKSRSDPQTAPLPRAQPHGQCGGKRS
jgi:hypothetical protein